MRVYDGSWVANPATKPPSTINHQLKSWCFPISLVNKSPSHTSPLIWTLLHQAWCAFLRLVQTGLEHRNFMSFGWFQDCSCQPSFDLGDPRAYSAAFNQLPTHIVQFLFSSLGSPRIASSPRHGSGVQPRRERLGLSAFQEILEPRLLGTLLEPQLSWRFDNLPSPGSANHHLLSCFFQPVKQLISLLTRI